MFALAVGSNTITVTYGGDPNFSGGHTTVMVNVQGTTPGLSVLVLDRHAAGALSLSGNASIKGSGTIQVDSSSAMALFASGNARAAASAIDVVGGYARRGHATLSPTPVTHAANVADPLAGLAAPTGGANRGFVVLSRGSRTINPGIYEGIWVWGNAQLTLNPGIYIVEGGGFSVEEHAAVKGAGVMIYEAGSRLPGFGNFFIGGINVSDDAAVDLTAPTSGPYTGIVFFQARNDARTIAMGGHSQRSWAA